MRPDFAEDRLAFCDTIPATVTSSMQVDLDRGNGLELPWLSGAVVASRKPAVRDGDPGNAVSQRNA
jgi:ketopantoate reductase